ncbi:MULTISPECIES: VC2046/SO_2500 family protein [Pseudoalteromonas]|uniref:VC2046/SO_2500 family protein n=1 Tax=Pseudoalteromonas TaxID=53246 RepID=UPI00029B0AAE|nr:MULTISPECIES: VC2046/SO_2500 family protein [Pseudoalteromonas]MBR8842836.1 queD like 2 [Pseudoalteromonas sp. JC3]NSY36246.1 queD like 2 [Pseudoalteromonas sp. JC28]QUI70605.1 queD like 2 [Pseudoalteromonas sp. M8]UDM62021.1 queD like 2 [Pseudoalteromonas piscicida]WJE10306.1 VC2046/SO_2500 family protein [Pseudoalteromonas sp. JC3]
MQIDGVLISESQLGSALNISVHQTRSADFAMLLSMLSTDALDFSQFHLPKSEAAAKDNSEETLKKQFEIGPQKPLAPKEYNMLIGQHNAQLVSMGAMATLRLQENLNPEPFAARNDKKHIPLDVVENLEPAVKRRLASAQGKLALVADKAMDAAGFYDQIATGDMQSMLRATA